LSYFVILRYAAFSYFRVTVAVMALAVFRAAG